MKTIRTILATLSVVLLGYGLFALISVKSEAALVQRTLYQLFSKSSFITLVLGVAFLLIAVILTIAIVSFHDDDSNKVLSDDEDDELFEAAPAEEAEAPAEEDVRSYQRPARPMHSAAFAAHMEPEPQEEEPESSTEADTEAAEEPDAVQKDANVRYCIYCGAIVPGEAVFCPSCGKRQ